MFKVHNLIYVHSRETVSTIRRLWMGLSVRQASLIVIPPLCSALLFSVPKETKDVLYAMTH